MAGGQLRELEYHCSGIAWVIIWNPNNAINIGECLIGAGGQLGWFYDITLLKQRHL